MPRFAPLLLVALATPAHADERNFMLAGFERVRVEGPFDVTVTSGVGPGATATGDTRSLDRVTVRLDGQTLVVSPGVNGWGGYPGEAKVLPRITVRVPALRAAAVFGGGRLSVDRMTGQRVDLSVSGAGSLIVGRADADRLDAIMVGTGVLKVAGAALTARFRSNGAGAIDAVGLVARSLIVDAQGSGNSSFAARETAQVSADGLGAIHVAGTPACTVRGTATVTCGKAR